MDRIELTESSLWIEAPLNLVADPKAGGIDVFVGTTRAETTSQDRALVALDYEAYPEMARREMAALEAEARRRWPILEAALAHRLGHLGPGEVSVAVAVSCPHRHQAFDACRWLIDTLKELVPIWKRETWADGTQEWVHPGLDARPP